MFTTVCFALSPVAPSCRTRTHIHTPQVQGFPNRTAIQTYLYDNPDTVISAVHFEFTGSTLEGFILQTNTTVRRVCVEIPA